MARTSDYRFIDKDPIIDVIRTELQRTGNLSNEQLERVAYDSGVQVQTIKNWLYHDVRFPRSLTSRFVLEALGVTIKYERSDGTNIREKPHQLISEAAQAKILKKDRERGRTRPED
jgi:hypothetical protein